MNDRDAVRRRELCQNYNFNPPLSPPSLHFLHTPLTFPFSSLTSSLLPFPFSSLSSSHFTLSLLAFSSSPCPSLSLPHLSLPSLSPSVPLSPHLSTSCSAEISAEAPVRLSGDRDGGCDITAPSTDCQPSAVAMATSATACGTEAGDETPAGGGGREEAGECVRILFHFLSSFFFCLEMSVVCACLCSTPFIVAS